jgi:hypothetical protein
MPQAWNLQNCVEQTKDLSAANKEIIMPEDHHLNKCHLCTESERPATIWRAKRLIILLGVLVKRKHKMNDIKKKSQHDRLVGALGGAGGTLVLIPLLDYLLLPRIWSLEVSIVSEAIGIFLITLGIIIRTRR